MAAQLSPSPKPRVLAFFREDTPGMARALLVAGLLISIGGFCTLLGGLERQLGLPVESKVSLGVCGTVLLIIGLLRGFVVFPRVLWRECSLSVEREGLRFTWHEREPEFYPWEQITRCEGTADALVLHLQDTSPRHIACSFGGKSFDELAKLIEACRRKAQFALL